MNHYQITLYITGYTPRSERALATLRYISEELLGGNCNITIVDVLEQPEIAEAERIMATPTVIKHSPPPHRRVIGDLSDVQRVAEWLGLDGDEGDLKRGDGARGGRGRGDGVTG